jgi:acyl-CoA thioesterase FadM
MEASMAGGASDRSSGASAVPPGHADWWHTRRQLWWRDFDALGHLTAGCYGALFQDAFADFVLEAWGSLDAWYVAIRMEIDYLHEVMPEDSPVRVYVELDNLGRSSFGATMVLCTRSGTPCSVSRVVFVAWDGEHRRSRPLTSSEREGLMATNRTPRAALSTRTHST